MAKKEKVQKVAHDATHEAKAAELRTTYGVKAVYRCPKKGYWFTRKDYAEKHAKEMDVELEVYNVVYVADDANDAADITNAPVEESEGDNE